MFANKVLLITGGTGSFGNAIVRRFISSDIREIRIFSRDEKKQDEQRNLYNNRKLKFYIGDVRDKRSVGYAMKDADYVFHAAALKQVPSCEFFPIEAVKTNVLGCENVIDSAIEHNVKKVIVLSTDKAVYPINAMGLSKALSEKVMIAKTRKLSEKETVLCGTRYGNVLASRGSVVPLFIEQIKKKKPVTITDPQMTRFMMTLDDAVDLVIHAFRHGKQGDLFVQKSPAASIQTIATALKELYGSRVPEKIIGTRHGEKLYETLVTREEMAKAKESELYYEIPPDSRDLNYNLYFNIGESKIATVSEYNSHNTRRLTTGETKELLLTLDFIKEDVNG